MKILAILLSILPLSGFSKNFVLQPMEYSTAAMPGKMVPGPMAGKKGLIPSAPQRKWTFVTKGDFFIEFFFALPEYAMEKIVVCSGQIDGRIWRIVYDKNRLNLKIAGEIIASYPFYYGGSLQKMGAANWHYLLLRRKGQVMDAACDGYLFRVNEKIILPGETHTFYLADPHFNVAYHALRASTSSPNNSGIRPRYLDFCRKRTPFVQSELPVVTVPALSKHPIIDVTSDESAKKEMSTLPLRCSMPDKFGVLFHGDCSAAVGSYDEQLYMVWNIQCGDKYPRRRQKRDSALWNEESIECFILPPNASHAYQFICSVMGDMYDGLGRDSSWNGNAVCVGEPNPGGWTGKLLIKSGKGLPPMEQGQVWKCNFFHSFAWAAWNPSLNYHDTTKFGLLRLDYNAPAINLKSFDFKDGIVKATLDIRGRHNTTLKGKLEVYAPGELEPIAVTSCLQIVANQPQRWDFTCDGARKDSLAVLSIIEADEVIFRQSGVLPAIKALRRE